MHITRSSNNFLFLWNSIEDVRIYLVIFVLRRGQMKEMHASRRVHDPHPMEYNSCRQCLWHMHDVCAGSGPDAGLVGSSIITRQWMPERDGSPSPLSFWVWGWFSSFIIAKEAHLNSTFVVLFSNILIKFVEYSSLMVKYHFQQKHETPLT